MAAPKNHWFYFFCFLQGKPTQIDPGILEEPDTDFRLAQNMVCLLLEVPWEGAPHHGPPLRVPSGVEAGEG